MLDCSGPCGAAGSMWYWEEPSGTGVSLACLISTEVGCW